MADETAAAPLDVQAFIDAHPLSRHHLLVFLLCFLVMGVDGFDMAVIGYVAPALREEWGLTPDRLAPLFAAGLAGLTVGSFVIGPLADRIGRRPVALLSILLFGLLSLASAAAPSLFALVLLRFLIGLGLGGAMPNAYTTAAEFCSAALRARLVAPVGCGIPLGGVFGGLIAAPVITGYGWRALLVLSGLLPLVLVVLLWRLLPESPRYLALAGKDPGAIVCTLQRLAPGERLAGRSFHVPERRLSGVPVRQLFDRALAGGTACLWIAAFLTLLVVFLLTNWLPTLFRGAGASLQQASFATALYLAGNTLGALLLGYAMDRLNPHRVLAVAFIAASVGLCIVGRTASWALLAPALLVTGTGTGGSMTGINILSAGFYPTASRATGVAWTLALGRIGSVVGSVAGGVMLSAGWRLPMLFGSMAVPVLAAAASLVAMDLWRRRRRAGDGA